MGTSVQKIKNDDFSDDNFAAALVSFSLIEFAAFVVNFSFFNRSSM